MKRMVISYSDEALPELKRMEAEGKVQLSPEGADRSQVIRSKGSVRPFDRNLDVIPRKKLPIPVESLSGSISHETAAEWQRQMDEMWERDA